MQALSERILNKVAALPFGCDIGISTHMIPIVETLKPGTNFLDMKTPVGFDFVTENVYLTCPDNLRFEISQDSGAKLTPVRQPISPVPVFSPVKSGCNIIGQSAYFHAHIPNNSALNWKIYNPPANGEVEIEMVVKGVIFRKNLIEGA